ncbi:hypothetical protein JAAARDRAFT_423472 [Jaapia argillacea MUCL 33604]|uniref:Uncharacterized protein n=1 Tax=Jaapia argillacea MUCL 33604 TaxID=933084 RepID=A0A067PTY5_9AGAM|nr:hypothetical protein JAAARDRAFT_423472 [Jaapia argillacea MUCL 33604]
MRTRNFWRYYVAGQKPFDETGPTLWGPPTFSTPLPDLSALPALGRNSLNIALSLPTHTTSLHSLISPSYSPPDNSFSGERLGGLRDFERSCTLLRYTLVGDPIEWNRRKTTRRIQTQPALAWENASCAIMRAQTTTVSSAGTTVMANILTQTRVCAKPSSSNLEVLQPGSVSTPVEAAKDDIANPKPLLVASLVRQ